MVSENASTVKYTERKQYRPTNNFIKPEDENVLKKSNNNTINKTIDKSQEEEIRSESMRTFVYLAAIAVGLILIIQVFQ